MKTMCEQLPRYQRSNLSGQSNHPARKNVNTTTTTKSVSTDVSCVESTSRTNISSITTYEFIVQNCHTDLLGVMSAARFLHINPHCRTINAFIQENVRLSVKPAEKLLCRVRRFQIIQKYTPVNGRTNVSSVASVSSRR